MIELIIWLLVLIASLLYIAEIKRSYILKRKNIITNPKNIQMKAIVIIEKEVKEVLVKAHVRRWEDAVINGVEDEDGTLTPCREGDLWCPVIDIDTGVILNWEKGKKADIHFKVCDSGSYYVKDAEGNVVLSIENDYVPNKLIPGSYGDYIEMEINEDGKIFGWKPSLEDFNDR